MQWNATFEQQLAWQTTVRVSYIGSAQQGMIVDSRFGHDQASDNPFGTTQGDPNYHRQINRNPIQVLTTVAIPTPMETAHYSYADDSRITFPELGDYVNGTRNDGKSMTNSLQFQAERKAKNLTYSVAYTYLDQKTTAADAQGSLGTDHYNPFNLNVRLYARLLRIHAPGRRLRRLSIFPLAADSAYGANMNRLTDSVIGGWQAHDQYVREVGCRVYAYLELRRLRSCHGG